MPKVSGLINDNERKIAARVREVRKSNRWSQSEFADALGETINRLASIEYARTPLTFGFAKKLGRTFHVDLEWLATGDGPTFTPFGTPLANEIQANDDSLFSDVFKTHIAPSLHPWPLPSDHYERGMIAEFWSDTISAAFEKITIEKLNVLDSQLREVLRQNIGEAPDFPAIKEFRRRFPSVEVKNKKQDLTHVSTNIKKAAVNHWHRLKAKIQKATEIPGGKSMLAKFLGVDLTQLSRWLSKTGPEPGADYTLKMLQWVQERESQQ